MLTKEEIKSNAERLSFFGRLPIYIHGWEEGATWATAQCTAKIVDIVQFIGTTKTIKIVKNNKGNFHLN